MTGRRPDPKIAVPVPLTSSRGNPLLRMPEPMFAALAIAVLCLIGATVGASVSSGIRRPLRDAEVQLRIRMWWYIVGGFFMALAIDRRLAVVALGLVSFVA